IEEIEHLRGRDVFIGEVRDVFSKTGSITNTTLLISELFDDTLITTNYDRLLEEAYSTGARDTFQVINGIEALEEPDPLLTSIIKLHGDVTTPARCILSKNQYNEAYGNDHINLSLPIPKLLEYHYRNSNLLFLGCSLQDDRTIQVFRAIKSRLEEAGEVDLPQHFAIEQAPETEEDLVRRNAFLESLGIAGIWFEKGQFGYVEDMLRLAHNELKYRGVLPRKEKQLPAPIPANNNEPNNRRNWLLTIIRNFLPT
ncbi:MAG: SIR2 family protein, partial [Alphaproteobacteria bacterium]|nr:SIR2 family protein [Alphaproteobacteria bacterium]